MFKNRAIFLIVISAILIPLIFIANDLISLAIFSLMFIITQVVMLYLFYKETELRLEQWYVFWLAVLSLGFMLALVLIGKSMLTESLGLLLFLTYFIGLLILLFKDRLKRKPKRRKEEKAVTEIIEEDLESFRNKDELENLAEFFEPDARKDVKIVDIEEPRIDNIFYERIDEEEEKQASKSLLPQKSEAFLKPRNKKTREAAEKRAEREKLFEEEEQDWRGELPKSVIFDYDEAKQASEKLQVKEIKEAPRVDFQKVKENLQKIDEGVKTIGEKIKLISEKAILEGAEKKLRELQAKRQPKPKKTASAKLAGSENRRFLKKELKVFASKTGTKFHYKKECLGLKRVKSKDVVTYTNSGDAKKKGLKACDLCR